MITKALYTAALDGTLTATERATIRHAARAAGVPLKNTRCKNCYADKVIELLTIQSRATGGEDVASGSMYRLKEPYYTQGINVNGRVFYGVTFSDADARYFFGLGLQKFVEKI